MIGVDWTTAKGDEVSATHMIGRQVRSIGVWLNPNPAEGEGWRNRDYVAWLEGLGIELPDGKNNKKVLVEVDPIDVLGLPCMVDIRLEVDKRDRDKDIKRKYPKVFRVMKWASGKKIDPKTLLPNVFNQEAGF
jgi:hypothetical protein